MAKNTKKKKKSKGSSSGGGAQQFLLWHGEKIVVGVVAFLALLLAVQGLGFIGKQVDWQASVLEEDAGKAEAAIRASKRSAEDEEITLFDYATYAEQIKQPIPIDPYRANVQWRLPILTDTGGGARTTDSSSSY